MLKFMFKLLMQQLHRPPGDAYAGARLFKNGIQGAKCGHNDGFFGAHGRTNGAHCPNRRSPTHRMANNSIDGAKTLV